MASEETVFLDSDVMLDHLADRQPFAEFAHRLFALAEKNEITIYVSSLSFSNLYYVLRKIAGADVAMQLLAGMLKIVKVASVGEDEVNRAFTSGFKDFEDGLQHEAAKSAGGVTGIVTRNTADFVKSSIPVFTPREFLARRQS
jgi:predicted nucleic acid-binding protein